MQTLDYKVNLDVDEALSSAQMFEARMGQLGGGGYSQMPYQPTNIERAFGDLSFSAGQFATRFQQPLGSIQTFTPGSISSMPHVNFATAATSVWAPGSLSVPQGVARYDFERHAQEQFAVQGGRGAVGAAWGFGKAAGLTAASSLIGGAVGLINPIAGAVVGFGAYFAGDELLGPVTNLMQDRAIIEDVVRASSKLDRSGVRGVASGLTDIHLSDPMLSASDTATIAGLGSRYGLMGKPTDDAQEYLKNFRELSASAKEVATALGTSLQEGLQTMAQLKGAGFGTGQIGGVIGQLSGMAGGDPGRIRGLIGTGMMGASAFNGTGMARTGGFWQAIGTQGAVAAAHAGGGVSAEMWHQAGGTAGGTRLMLGSNMQFQESGMGIAMQAGLYQGGTNMSGYAGGDAFGLMSQGLGGMASGDFLAFNRNRAEAVGKMNPRDRMMMQAQSQMQIAEMMADSLGGDVGDALFMMAQGQGMSTPQAQLWAATIQKQANGKFGGGGSARSRLRARLVGATNERNKRVGADAVLGGFRDKLDRFYNDTFVEPLVGVQAAAEDWLADYVDHRSEANADVDLVLASVDGQLKGVAAQMTGMDVSEYKWAGELGALGKQKFTSAGKGRIKVAPDTFYASSDIYGTIAESQRAATTAWGTDAEQVRNGREGDMHRVYRGIATGLMASAQGRAQVRNAYAEHGYTGALAEVGASFTDAASLGGARVALEDYLGIKGTAEDVYVKQHQQVSVAVTEGQRATETELRTIMGMGDRSKERIFRDKFAAGGDYAVGGPDGIVGTADDPLVDSGLNMMFRPASTGQRAYAAGKRQGRSWALSAAGWVGGQLIDGVRTMTGGALAIAGAVQFTADAAGAYVQPVDTEMRGLYKQYKGVVGDYIDEMGSITKDETEEARKRLKARGELGAVGVTQSGQSLDAIAIADEAFVVSTERARDGLRRKMAEDSSPAAQRLLGKLENMAMDENKKVVGNVVALVDEHGGAGTQLKKGKAKTVVPIALGADANDRDLYNAVQSLYQSVKALEKRTKATPAGGEDPAG